MSLHPDCVTSCRRGEDVNPCRVIGGCGVEWAPVCVLCTVNLDRGHVCHGCSERILKDLGAVLSLTISAATQTTPSGQGGQGGRTVPGSRPPLTIDALDPELAAVRLVPDDASSDVPLLVVLEDWERIIREDRAMVPYGIASEARLAAIGPLHAYTWAAHTPVTLSGVIGFLMAHHDWTMTEPSFDLAEYARQIRLCRKAVARWDLQAEPGGWRVPCPTVTEDGDCDNALKVIRGAETVFCRRCGRDWDLPRLLAVAGRDADVWVDVEAAATLAGVHEQTIRKWVRRGTVSKRGQLVRVLDVRAYAHSLGA
jgi:hypothetical protein